MFALADGAFVSHLAGPEDGINHPWDVAEAEDGGLLVANCGTHAVVALRRGRPPATLGSQGRGLGRLDHPSALALLPGGGLVVRESGTGGRFQVFTPLRE